MVSVRTVRAGVLATSALGGVAAGFMVDRALADSEYRREKRLPDIALPADRGSWEDSEAGRERRDGFGRNVANLWLPVVGMGVGVATLTAPMWGILPADRMWLRHPVGIAGVAIGAASVGWFAGAASSRIALG